LGYYPLPAEEARKIKDLLQFSAPYAVIDPCAGNGAALLEIAGNTSAHLSAIELDADRAAAAADKGIRTVHGSAFDCRVASETCSLLYLNPPYDYELGAHGNRRMERLFLEHCYRWVVAEGVLVFVIPATALGACARLLASQFDRISVYRLEHPESIRFKQVVVFGTRKKAHLRGDPGGADSLIRTGYRPDLIRPLNQDVAQSYAIPASAPATINHLGLPLDELEDALARSAATHNALAVLVRQHVKVGGRPLTPLHAGHVGLLAVSSMLNGVYGTGDGRHIAAWRSTKVTESSEEVEEDGTIVRQTRERFTSALTLVFVSGEVKVLR
jgi:predicted RNA methylase